MKTKEILDKYQKIVAGLLKVNQAEIRFFMHANGVYDSEASIKAAIKSGQLREIKEIEYFEPEKDEDNNETGNQIRCTRWQNWSEGNYFMTLNYKLIASWELYKLPHCCAILVSCRAHVKEEFRGKRVGTILNNLRQDIGKLLGYSTLMCTDIGQNVHQRQLLATNGWKDIHEVKNKRTGNKVYVSVINL